MPELTPTPAAQDILNAAREAKRLRRILLGAAWTSAVAVTAVYAVIRETSGPSWIALAAWVTVILIIVGVYLQGSTAVRRRYWEETGHPLPRLGTTIHPEANLKGALDHRDGLDTRYQHTIPYPTSQEPLIRRHAQGTLRAVAQEDIPAGAHMELDPATGMMRRVRPYQQDITQGRYDGLDPKDPNTTYWIKENPS